MIRFLAGLAVTVATVIVVLRLIGAAESAATPAADVGSSSITVVDPCQTGERAVVRALPDGSIEGVQCR
ncbi:hypothetical protein [Pseudonocardia sp. WMMC193]|uniref:hypothetical protein n=1 Tax=Pseudonocardia sp. WMMC193 TaxID=2911965 RepID=UPI001F3C71F9|nr:hypothetical protein [Pseudonocardia sp. WMMC193]MCF7551480.1 hypothetical protein [Pseudonocardia sp. WMMC193]